MRGQRRHAAVERAIAEGLPSVLVAPLRSLVGPSADLEVRRVEALVEKSRAALPHRIDSEESLGKPQRDIREEISVSGEWGRFLHMCARSTNAEVILELGSAFGISGCYLALAPACREFHGLDKSADRLAIARQSFDRCGILGKAHLSFGLFSDTLPGLLEGGLRPDLVWIDDDHQKGSTLGHLTMLAPYLKSGALVILDDIRWSQAMQEAWQLLCEDSRFQDTVDLGRIGLGIIGEGDERPRRWDFSAAIAWPIPERFLWRRQGRVN